MGVGLGLEGGGGGGSRKILKPQDQDYKILLPRFFSSFAYSSMFLDPEF